MQERILLSHGSGGLMMKNLLNEVVFNVFNSRYLQKGDDSAILTLKDVIGTTTLSENQKLAFSSDSFVVDPIFFPGGDIGRLAVCGTVNDITTSGAKPIALSVSFIIEEGFEISKLKKICDSIKLTCEEANVEVVTGDTKVVNKGLADRIYINTAGIGILNGNIDVSGSNCKDGDKVIFTGSIGDHGATIMCKRAGIRFDGDVESDVCPLNLIIQRVINRYPEIHALRDPTRGGVASTLNEFARQSCVDIKLYEEKVPIKESVKSICDLLGLNVYHVANEGKMVMVVPNSISNGVLDILHEYKYTKNAAIVGEVLQKKDMANTRVYIETKYKTRRILDELSGEQLPRIC